MVKKIMIDFDEAEYGNILKAKGTFTWKQLFMKGVEAVQDGNDI